MGEGGEILWCEGRVIGRLRHSIISRYTNDASVMTALGQKAEKLRQSRCFPLYSQHLYVGDLVQKSESEVRGIPNFGRKGLHEIRDLLRQMGLHLGMEVQGWPPKNVGNLAKLFEDANVES
jgi:DNA-directed RNA polymerase subunit alpha